jgi:hypothetical protein
VGGLKVGWRIRPGHHDRKESRFYPADGGKENHLEGGRNTLSRSRRLLSDPIVQSLNNLAQPYGYFKQDDKKGGPHLPPFSNNETFKEVKKKRPVLFYWRFIRKKVVPPRHKTPSPSIRGKCSRSGPRGLNAVKPHLKHCRAAGVSIHAVAER